MLSKIKIIIALILLLSTLNSFGGAIDSLKKEYNQQKNGQNKIYTAYRILAYYETNYDTASFYYQKFLSDCKKTNNKFGEAFIVYKMAAVEMECAKYEEAKKDFNYSGAIFKEYKNDTMIASSHVLLGFVFYTQANYETAIKTYLTAIDYAIKGNRPKFIAWGYNLLGLAFYAKPNADYKKELYYYFKALDINRKNKQENASGLILMRIGTVYTKMEDYTNAGYYLNKALRLGDSLKIPMVTKWSLEALTGFYRQKHDYYKAIDAGERSLIISLQFGEMPGIIISHRNIAENYMALKNYKIAMVNIDSAIFYSLKYKIFQTLPNIYEVKSTICEQSGLTGDALLYYKKSIQLKDSLFSVQNSKNINELETKFESKEKEKEIKFLNKEKESDKKIKVVLSIAFILALLSIGMVVFFLIKINGSRKQLRQQKEIIEAKQKEILDSIRYAKRIQISLLPTEKYIEKGLKNNDQKINK